MEENQASSEDQGGNVELGNVNPNNIKQKLPLIPKASDLQSSQNKLKNSDTENDEPEINKTGSNVGGATMNFVNSMYKNIFIYIAF